MVANPGVQLQESAFVHLPSGLVGIGLKEVEGDQPRGRWGRSVGSLGQGRQRGLLVDVESPRNAVSVTSKFHERAAPPASSADFRWKARRTAGAGQRRSTCNGVLASTCRTSTSLSERGCSFARELRWAPSAAVCSCRAMPLSALKEGRLSSSLSDLWAPGQSGSLSTGYRIGAVVGTGHHNLPPGAPMALASSASAARTSSRASMYPRFASRVARRMSSSSKTSIFPAW